MSSGYKQRQLDSIGKIINAVTEEGKKWRNQNLCLAYSDGLKERELTLLVKDDQNVVSAGNLLYYNLDTRVIYAQQRDIIPIPPDSPTRTFIFKLDAAYTSPNLIVWVFEYFNSEECAKNHYILSPGRMSFSHEFSEAASEFKIAFRFSGEGLVSLKKLTVAPGMEETPGEPAVAFGSDRAYKIRELRQARDPREFPILEEIRVCASRGWDALESRMKNLRVATIMDDFTWNCYSGEAKMTQLTPDNYLKELEDFRPEMLFVESAWRGKDEKWFNTVSKLPDELLSILWYCREHKIPTFFWNKEDGAHFSTFINIAVLFDFVATYDMDCVPWYKAETGRDNAFFLPMGVQPRLFNPIEKYERKPGLCFAGSYYRRFPHRCAVFDSLVDSLSSSLPVDIYDRQQGQTDPDYMFPERYRPIIKGKLPYTEIDRAYKGYRYALNMNSGTISQTHIARRVFELLACNTLIISNYARGLHNIFKDLVIAANDGKLARRKLDFLASRPFGEDRLKLMGLRKAMRENLYVDRLASILCFMADTEIPSPLPPILVVGIAEDPRRIDKILANFERQEYENKKLLLVVPDDLKVERPLPDNVELVANAPASELFFGVSAWIAVFSASDWYGPNYLLDLALASRYADFDAVGKGSYFILEKGELRQSDKSKVYRWQDSLPVKRALIHPERVRQSGLTAGELPAAITRGRCLSIDPFNYCHEAGDAPDEVLADLGDLPDVDTGISMRDLQKRSMLMPPEGNPVDDGLNLFGEALLREFSRFRKASRVFVTEKDKGAIVLTSTLPPGKVEYKTAINPYSVKDLLKGGDNKMRFLLHTGPGADVMLGYSILDANGEQLSGGALAARRNVILEAPEGADKISIALRVKGPGEAEIKGLYFSHVNPVPHSIIADWSHLVLTNVYPAYDNLYRNAFVHSRVRLYKDRGLNCGVFQYNPYREEFNFDEFEGIDILRSGAKALRILLESGKIKSVAVHFLTPQMWAVLKDFADRIKITIWLHGSDVQPWTRRVFNIFTPEDLERAKAEGEARRQFWSEFFENIPEKTRLVFVSRYMAEEVMEDYGVDIPASKYSVIHNPIDTGIFRYSPKTAADRYRLLMISPFSSRKYGPHMIAPIVSKLAERPDFGRFRITIVGDGAFYEEATASLRQYTNVTLRQGYVPQAEIASLHRGHGVFICPTLWDSQGVSRGEAMASGLVPVTNRVAAIPEFVDESCAIIAPPDDTTAMAEGIGFLVDNPEAYLNMSEAAAARAVSQLEAQKITDQELNLIQ
ncbi:MAG: glycosyltransferase [Desulfovibrio sp.]|nr:glycosyltransferase [Desulfovibrio sp.]